jgi:hypothetical protein
MTGNEIVRKVRSHRGKVQMPVLFAQDTVYMYVEKADIIDRFKRYGDTECEMEFHVDADGDAYIDRAY